jgi:hypothetical protein
MTSHCDCETVDVCSLFDDRVLSLDDPELPPTWRMVVIAT